MKRILFLLVLLTAFAAQSSGKTCRVCGGLGHAFGNSSIKCSACGGRGIVDETAAEKRREARDNDRYANSANNLMNEYNLTPQEFFAFEELTKQAMMKVPIYQKCTACGGSGKCKFCGGYMNVSLDGPLCRGCGGVGSCIACRGAGQIKIGEQDNPNKEQLIKRANEILHHGSARKSGGVAPAPVPSDGDVLDDDDSDGFSGSHRKKSSSSDVLYGILAVCGLGGLGYLLFRKK